MDEILEFLGVCAQFLLSSVVIVLAVAWCVCMVVLAVRLAGWILCL